jgi:small GTP-binding protein
MSEIKTLKHKIALLGDAAVGKTSLIRRFVIDKFDDKYISTVGTKVTRKALLMDDDQGTQVSVVLMIWDFMGQKGFRNIEKDSLRGTSGAIVVCDVSRPDTLTSLEDYWIPILFKTVPGVPVVFLANKIDLLSKNEKDSTGSCIIEEFQNVVKQYNASGYLTSALTGENVEEAFGGIGKEIVRSIPFRPTIQSHEPHGCPEPKYFEPAIIKVADEIIMDFYREYGSSMEETMPIIRKQFENAGIDINNPTIESLRKAVELLGEVESSFFSQEEVATRLKKRMSLINQITK